MVDNETLYNFHPSTIGIFIISVVYSIVYLMCVCTYYMRYGCRKIKTRTIFNWISYIWKDTNERQTCIIIIYITLSYAIRVYLGIAQPNQTAEKRQNSIHTTHTHTQNMKSKISAFFQFVYLRKFCVPFYIIIIYLYPQNEINKRYISINQ